MSKTWETLFNLSSFMKYLLTKALPDEKLEAPSYILDSLYDLLSVTCTWIDKIKPISNENISLKNQLAEHSAQLILSSRSNKNNEGSTSQSSIRRNDPANGALTPSSYFSKGEINNNAAPSLENLSKDISETFMRLSKEMINGRPYGHYCRPCDLAIFSKKDWDNHMADRLHTFLLEDCDIKHASCVYCKLIIFALYRDANKFFKYHEAEHHLQDRNNVPMKENASKNDSYKKPFKTREKDFVITNGDSVTNRSEIEVNSNFKTNQRNLSPIFIELDKKMHSGKEKGFFCLICDKAFDVVTEWNMHFQEAAVHKDQYDSSGCFAMCDSCSLVIFAVPSILERYKSHHMSGHYSSKGEKKSNFKSSVESLQSVALSQENLYSYKNNGQYQSNESTNTYKISQQFKDFNAKIHTHNLQGHFYCRPCNATLSPEDWIKHSVNKKHSELMASRKFKNWKGTCTYCSLTIIGTRDTVKYYMEFHSVQHNKVISYEFVKISSVNMPNNFSSNQSKRKPRTRKLASPNSISTVGDDEDRSDFEDKEINGKNEPISSDVSGENSWYASSREEQMFDSIRQLIESRTNEKYTCGISKFGAYCTLCEYIVDDGFEWEDHLSSDEHCLRLTPQDRQAFLSDLNVKLFGSMNVFEKYKSLVKGNWSFIEN